MWENTRWGPATTIQTYFGKPAFEAYGRANTNPPAVGAGIFYGQHLHTHNLNPQRGPNHPPTRQLYIGAEHAWEERLEKRGMPAPTLSRKPLPDEGKMTKEEMEQYKSFKPIEPPKLEKTLRGNLRP